jgi:hypothetical protein
MYAILKVPSKGTSPVIQLECEPRDFIVMEFTSTRINSETGEIVESKGRATFKKTEECVPHGDTLAEIYEEISVDFN